MKLERDVAEYLHSVNFGLVFFIGKETHLLIEELSPQHPAAHGVLRMILELNGEEILRADPVGQFADIHKLLGVYRL